MQFSSRNRSTVASIDRFVNTDEKRKKVSDIYQKGLTPINRVFHRFIVLVSVSM